MESWRSVAAWLDSCESFLPNLRCSPQAVPTWQRETENKLSGVRPSKGTISVMGPPSSWPHLTYLSPKAPFPNILTLWVSVSTDEFWGHKHSVHKRPVSFSICSCIQMHWKGKDLGMTRTFQEVGFFNTILSLVEITTKYIQNFTDPRSSLSL